MEDDFFIKKIIIDNSNLLLMAAQIMINKEDISEKRKIDFIETIFKQVDENNNNLIFLNNNTLNYLNHIKT